MLRFSVMRWVSARASRTCDRGKVCPPIVISGSFKPSASSRSAKISSFGSGSESATVTSARGATGTAVLRGARGARGFFAVGAGVGLTSRAPATADFRSLTRLTKAAGALPSPNSEIVDSAVARRSRSWLTSCFSPLNSTSRSTLGSTVAATFLPLTISGNSASRTMSASRRIEAAFSRIRVRTADFSSGNPVACVSNALTLA